MGFGLLLRRTGKIAAAEAQYRKAQGLYQELVKADPAVPEFRSFLAHSHDNLGNLLADTGRSPEAEVEYGRALSLRQGWPTPTPPHLDFRGNWRGACSTSVGISPKPAGPARRRLRRAGRGDPTAARRTVLGDPRRHRMPGELPDQHGGHAPAVGQAGRGARRMRAPGQRKPLVAAHSEFPLYRGALGETYLRLGQVRCDMEDAAGAADAWKRACATSTGPRPWVPN